MMNIPDCFYRVSAKALVLDNQKRFLLIKEKDNEKWELPGGGLDFGESPQEAIKRELKEEMGLEATYIADKPSYFVTSRHDEKPVWVAIVLYETKLKDLNYIPSEECTEIGFFSPSEASELSLWLKVEEFIKQYNPDNHF